MYNCKKQNKWPLNLVLNSFITSIFEIKIEKITAIINN